MKRDKGGPPTCASLTKLVRGGGRKERKEKKGEKLLILSSFFEDPTVDVRRSKRQSRSSQQELHVGTEIGDFFQASRGREFSYLV